ncbi:MAG: tetratricopeptide repeat protein [Capsulimonadales bacterium]|nr:tetratricopeptide repeat protein [Capsulimonadales bacterium]
MNRTLFTALSLSLTLLTIGAANAGDIPSLPTTAIAHALVGFQGADDEFNAGVEAQRKRLWDKAIVFFSNAVKKDPTYWVAYYSRGDCYMQLGQYEKAIADYTQVIDKKPKLADAYRFRGRAYNRLKQPDKAIEDFNKALQIKGQNFYEIYGDLGQSYQIKNDYPKAIENYSTFIERLKRTRQSVPDAFANRGNAYLSKYQADKEANKANEDDVKAALADYEEYIAQATAANQDPSDAYRSRADAYLITKNYDKAISNYSLYLAKNAKDSYALERRGVAYEESKNVDAAMKDFRDALAVNPTSANAQAGVTRIMLTRDPKTALAELSKGISNPPKKEQKDKVASRALVYMQLKDYANAVRDYDFLAKVDPNDPTVLSNRATANLNLNAYDKAIADYNAYLALKPQDTNAVANALTGKAAAQINLRQYGQAADTFTQIIANNEAAKVTDPEPYFNRAKAYFNAGAASNNDRPTLQKAIADLDVYLKAKPDNKEASKLKTDIELLSAGSPEEQVAALTKAIAADPTNAVYRTNLGTLYFRQGEKDPANYDRAITAYNEAIRISPNDPVAVYSRAAVYAKKKDWENTAKDASAALALKPDYPDALLLRAQANLEAKKYADAVRDYEAIYAKDRNNADALKGLAFAYVANKDYANTVRIMNEYIPKHPDDTEAVYSRGVAHVGLGKYTEGIADLTKYIDAGGKEKAVALYNRGLAHSKAGNDVAAAADYEASIALKNDYNTALEAARAYSVQGDKFRDPDPAKAAGFYGKAFDLYGKAMTALEAPEAEKTDLAKKRANILRSQAIVRQNQGKLAENIEILKEALTLFNQYLTTAKPLGLPEYAETEKTAQQLDKYIKDNS